MEITLQPTTKKQFTSYSEGRVTIGGQNYHDNIMVFNDQVYQCSVKDIKVLTLEDLAEIINYQPDLIIFGSGDKVVYPDLKVIEALYYKSIGVEVMPIQALCRTFNFLVGEERKVACVLFFP